MPRVMMDNRMNFSRLRLVGSYTAGEAEDAV